jgi:crossover junction endodeoxyribonuclease RuvC
VKILGIDPGTRRCGYGFIQHSSRKNEPVYLASGVIQAGTSKEAMHIRLLTIYNSLNSLIDKYQPAHMALEKVFFHKNAQSSFALGQVRGVALLLAANRSLEVFEYNPTEVKQAVTGFGRAEKMQVMEMVKRIIKVDKKLKEDEADALGLCICHMNMFQFKELSG